jgi:integrase/recombinase XerD
MMMDLDTATFRRAEVLDFVALFEEWIRGQTACSRLSYKYRMNALQKKGFVELRNFGSVNLNEVIDNIFASDLKLDYRQALISLVISFSKFLSRRTRGAFPVAMADPNVFKGKRDKVACNALDEMELRALLCELRNLSDRAFLIGALGLFGAKRVNEILSLKVEDISFETCEATFTQSKSRTAGKRITVTLPREVVAKLREFVGERTGLVFITKKGTATSRGQVQNDFHKASARAGLTKKVTSHCMRASAITLWSRGYRPDQIMRVSGHETIKQVLAYDKTSQADNLTRYDQTLSRVLGV